MSVLTKWVCFNGKVGVTSNGEYYDLSTFKKIYKEYKVEKQVEIPLCPF